MTAFSPPVTICVTAYNEAANVPQLARAIHELLDRFPQGLVVSIVDNGSEDDTFALLRDQFSNEMAHADRVALCRIDPNRLYGGGMLAAIAQAPTGHLALIPADGQYSASDIALVLETWRTLVGRHPDIMVKGARVQRGDPAGIQVLSRLYSVLGRIVFGLPAVDVNGLPKILPRDLFDAHGSLLPKDAIFDASILFLHCRRQRAIVEVPVAFHARVTGVSSWSGRVARTGRRMLISSVRTRWRLRRVR